MKQNKFTIKHNNTKFSLLHLEYNETYLNSIDAYVHKLGEINPIM